MMLAKDPTLADLKDADDMAEVDEHPLLDRDVFMTFIDAGDRSRTHMLIGVSSSGRSGWPTTTASSGMYVPRRTALRIQFRPSPCPLEASALRKVIDIAVNSLHEEAVVPSWVLGNHDAEVTRYGRRPACRGMTRRPKGWMLVLGTRRARAAALLSMSLPGALFIYQGEELGLPEVEDLPDDALQDPIWELSGRHVRGRDGCRVPSRRRDPDHPLDFPLTERHRLPSLRSGGT